MMNWLLFATSVTMAFAAVLGCGGNIQLTVKDMLRERIVGVNYGPFRDG